MSLIAVQKLKKSFGARTLFEDIDFAIEPAERVGLIGPNGAGKSTLLAILADRQSPDSGEVVRQKGAKIALLDQVPVLDLEKTVLDTILENCEGSISTALEVFSKTGLDAVGVTPETPVGQLSGGWRKRAALARALAAEPDLLLLDEPTNHLDVESILWLEEFLGRAPFSTITITHDRAFLQNTSNRILELDRRNPGGMLKVAGDYATYLEKKEALLANQRSQEESLRNRLRRETEWLRRGAKARTTKQKARIQRAGELKEDVGELAARNQSQSVRLTFDGSQRRSKRLIEAVGVSKSIEDRTLFEDFSVFLGPGSRLGLIGQNGCGKTTLIRTLLGETTPDAGSILQADELQIAYFEQHRESLDPTISVQKAVCPSGDHVLFQDRSVHVRSYLDRFLFSAEQADQPVSKLSGGEQSRLLIARLMLKKADVLVLDEPTNDLDISTLDVLEDCLIEFPGAVILVSHDRYFLDRVSNILYGFHNGQLTNFADLHQWEQWRENLSQSAKSVKSADRREKKKRKLGYKEVRELEGMEAAIQKAEKTLESLTAQAHNPENVANAAKLSSLYAEIAAAQEVVDKLFVRWQELETLKTDLENES
ncbi:MAG: ABC-F family ATP-binding cassette domain-containing protein [Bdellovibrionaceae bacterium]|nr:ABC-F family ATP-binding cassette domain-containing protein [Pseudobdellovibrionaceae bacterium]